MCLFSRNVTFYFIDIILNIFLTLFLELRHLVVVLILFNAHFP